MQLEGKVALVTGSARGIGQATALRLGRLGVHVAVNYHRSREQAEETSSVLRSAGVRSQAYQADVANPSDVKRMVAEVKKDFGSIDILVNNAGEIVRPGNWDYPDEALIDRTIDVNLKGPMHCIRSVAPIMLENHFGRIVNVTTTYAILGAAAVASYTAAKAGVISLTKGFAKEFAPYVTVNAVAPGNVDTAMTQSAGPDVVQWAIDTTPLRRLGRPEEIADAIVFLASADFITAHVLVVDGGQMSQIL